MALVWGVLFLLTNCQDSVRVSSVSVPPLDPVEWISVDYNVADIRVTELRPRPVDILFSIDNSGSMSQWQKLVIDNTERFMREFTKTPGLDARFGLISMTLRDLPYIDLKSPLSSKDPNIVTLFQQAVNRLGIDGPGTEKMFEPVRKALLQYPVFVRNEAVLALITITDAHEQSDGIDPAAEFFRFIESVKGSISNVRALGAFSPHPECRNGWELPWAWSGSAYEALINQYHGSWYPICSTDFGGRFVELAKQIVESLFTASVILPRPADVLTIEISLDGRRQPGASFNYNPGTRVLYFSDFGFAANARVLSVRFRVAKD